MNKKTVSWLRGVLAIFILIFAVTTHASPYITPYTPSGWSSPVVVTTNPSSITNTPTIYTTNEIYVDWSVINESNANANSTFYVDLYTNSVYMTSWTINGGLPGHSYTYVTGFGPLQFPTGTNTVELVADAT